MPKSRYATRAFDTLERLGFLLLQDAKLPNLAALVAGETVSGSWWGHRAGHEIFNTAGELDDHPDVLTTKLVAGKVTFVHRRLFPALVVIGSAREKWQIERLPAGARKLLARVDREEIGRTKGPDAKLLEKRLLCASREVHTESGAHAIELVAWKRLARERKIRAGKLTVERAKRQIEDAVDDTALPWSRT